MSEEIEQNHLDNHQEKENNEDEETDFGGGYSVIQIMTRYN